MEKRNEGGKWINITRGFLKKEDGIGGEDE